MVTLRRVMLGWFGSLFGGLGCEAVAPMAPGDAALESDTPGSGGEISMADAGGDLRDADDEDTRRNLRDADDEDAGGDLRDAVGSEPVDAAHDGGTSGRRPVSVVGGTAHTCVLFSDGTIRCWGLNNGGQLGDGTRTSSEAPVEVQGISNATALSAGQHHTCAVLADGSVRCWGVGTMGELGNGQSNFFSTPQSVLGLSGARLVTTGAAHSCAIRGDGTMRCWGHNAQAELGLNQVNVSPRLSNFEDVLGVRSAILGASGGQSTGGHTCVVLRDRTAMCWGLRSLGRLGRTLDLSGPTGATGNGAPPGPVENLRDATSIVTGGEFSCASTADGRVHCWGRFPGPAGSSTLTPVPMAGLSNVEALATGTASSHVCARLRDTTVRCWGLNLHGQLGHGDTTFYPSPGVPVEGLTGVVALGLGTDHSCAIVRDGAVYCWGRNHEGQLGDGTNSSRSRPVQVRGL